MQTSQSLLSSNDEQLPDLFRHKHRTCILCEHSSCCAFEEMASTAGNEQRYSEHTLDVKYVALMKIEWGVTNRDDSKKFNVSKNTLSTWKKNRDKIVSAFKSSGETKTQGHTNKLF